MPDGRTIWFNDMRDVGGHYPVERSGGEAGVMKNGDCVSCSPYISLTCPTQICGRQKFE